MQASEEGELKYFMTEESQIVFVFVSAGSFGYIYIFFWGGVGWGVGFKGLLSVIIPAVFQSPNVAV